MCGLSFSWWNTTALPLKSSRRFWMTVSFKLSNSLQHTSKLIVLFFGWLSKNTPPFQSNYTESITFLWWSSVFEVVDYKSLLRTKTICIPHCWKQSTFHRKLSFVSQKDRFRYASWIYSWCLFMLWNELHWVHEKSKYWACLLIPISLKGREHFFDWSSMSMQSVVLCNVGLARSIPLFCHDQSK